MRRILLYALLLSMSGCNQKFYIVETIQRNGTLIFTSRAVNEKCDGPIYFTSGFGITYIGEKDSGVAWEVKRKETMNLNQVESEFPLKYGDKSPRFETRVEPMEIRPGKYKIATEIVCHSEGGTRGMTLFGTFLIDAEGNLIPTD